MPKRPFCSVNVYSLAASLTMGLGLVLSNHVAAPAADAPIRVAYTPTLALLPAFIANDEGIFRKNGLSVTLIPIQNQSLLPGTLGKQIDIAISTQPDLLKSSASGLDVVTICGETVETAANHIVELIVRKDSGITNIKDLKGKVIGTPTIGAGIHTATLHWLHKSGIDVNSIRAVEVPFPNMEDQLKSKRVDAVEAVQPFAGKILAAGGVSLGDPNLHVSDPSLQTLWIANGTWARANPKIVRAWTDSVKSAIAFIKSNPAEARTILGKYTHLPKAVVEHIRIPVYETAVSPQQIDVWINLLVEMGQLAHTLNPEKLIVAAH